MTEIAKTAMFCYTEATRDVLEEIAHERQRQDEQWGGSQHDDQHDPSDWLRFIGKQIAHANASRSDMDPVDYRARLVKIAALAVAGIEAHDRLFGRTEADESEPSTDESTSG